MGMEYEEALKYEQFWYDAEVRPSEEVLKELGKTASPCGASHLPGPKGDGVSQEDIQGAGLLAS